MASGFTTTHACHCWSRTYKALSGKCPEQTEAAGQVQAAPPTRAALTETLGLSPLHFRLVPAGPDDHVAGLGWALTLPQRWKSGGDRFYGGSFSNLLLRGNSSHKERDDSTLKISSPQA